MRTRRKKRWTWLPVIGTLDPAGGTDDTNGRTFGVPVDPSGASNIIIFPLVPDVQTDEDNVLGLNAQLLLALSTDYEIERIVGKMFVSFGAPIDDVEAVFVKVVQVSAGLFVAKQSEVDVTLPVETASLAQQLENYNPASNDTTGHPWMWRRDWVLSSGRHQPIFADGRTHFGPVVTNTGLGLLKQDGAPTTNISYGSVMDGPHIDVKSNRRVRSDSRLFCAVSVRSLDRQLDNITPTGGLVGAEVKGIINIRVLGATRRPQKQGSFT